MPQKKPNFKTSFSSVPLKTIVQDKYLSNASLNSLRSFLPNVDLETNYDLLAAACDACVVNRVNKNDDVIDTEEAIAIYKLFINKFIDIEHDRKYIVGVILNSSLSSFGTNKPIEESEIKDKKNPFYITLGGVIWRAVNNKLAEIIEESNDPTSSDYMTVSASWELGFDYHQILILPAGEKNLEDGEIVTDEDKIKELSPTLRANGGSGKLDDGRRVYRLLKGCIAMGIGLTETPAAEVKGVATATETPENIEEDMPITEKLTQAILDVLKEQSKEGGLLYKPAQAAIEKNVEKNSTEISQLEKNNVKQDSKIMKITKVQDITDESLKQVQASELREFIETEFKSASEKFAADKKAKEEALAESIKTQESLKKSQEETEKKLSEVQAQLDSLAKEKKERDAQDKFNQRMAAMDEAYDLNADDRKAIAGQVKDLSDEAFASYQKQAEVLLKEKSKAHKKSVSEAAEKARKDEEKAAEDKKLKEATASEKKDVVDAAIDNAKKDKVDVANTGETKTLTLKEKFAKAFADSEYEISAARK